MGILSKYISQVFLKWLLWISLILTVIILLFDFVELLRRSSAKIDLTALTVLQMSLVKLPTLYLQILPFVVLFSSIISFWTFNRSHELTIFRSLGLSVWKIILPMVLGVTILGGLEIAVVNPLASTLMLKYEHMEDRYFRGNLGSLAVSDSGLWFREVDDQLQTVYRIGKIDVHNHSVSPISIFRTNKQDQFVERFDAKTGTFYGNKIYLKDVYVLKQNQLPVFQGESEIPSRLTFHALQDSGADPTSLSFWQLPGYIKLLEHSGLSPHKYALHWHGILSKWLWLSVMVLLAATCCLNPMRQRKNTRLVFTGLGVAFFMYVLKDMSMAMGLSLKLPIILAAWAPTLLSGLMAVTVLLYSEDG